MKNNHFMKRNKCPVCSSCKYTIIYKCAFDESPIKEYLHRFYSPQGSIEQEYLCGASYTLAICNVCKLVFQEEIPDTALTIQLYDKWLDPEKDYALHQQLKNLNYFSQYAQEIMQIIAFILCSEYYQRRIIL